MARGLAGVKIVLGFGENSATGASEMSISANPRISLME